VSLWARAQGLIFDRTSQCKYQGRCTLAKRLFCLFSFTCQNFLDELVQKEPRSRPPWTFTEGLSSISSFALSGEQECWRLDFQDILSSPHPGLVPATYVLCGENNPRSFVDENLASLPVLGRKSHLYQTRRKVARSRLASPEWIGRSGDQRNLGWLLHTGKISSSQARGSSNVPRRMRSRSSSGFLGHRTACSRSASHRGTGQ